ncbi:hypothetical protein [Muricoccus pecuniae]|uniref:Uncharacterized protein n=1 Tax=Muricoccus pecuniae TaxID=693023 RepID=A0A840YDU1_9PROT|nr:hypothetical protein [Roseomonas pecuniae]MBB5694321.1 hypothetical protein [Roseomonas pecuniae]
MAHDAASRAADAILDVLSGPLDECRHALHEGNPERANLALSLVADQLRRIRRDLREEGHPAEESPGDLPG